VKLIFFRDLIDLYHDEAKEKKILIVPCCGLDCIPSDLGTFLAVKKLEELGKTCKRVKSSVIKLVGGISGGTTNTLFSINEIPKSMRSRMMRPYALNPEDQQTGSDRDMKFILKDSDFGWISPFLLAFADTRVVRRSAALMKYHDDFRYIEGKSSKYFISALFTFLIVILLQIILTFSFTRKFSRRFFPSTGEGPSLQKMNSGCFKMGFVAYPDDDSEPLKVLVTMKKDPGYMETSKMISETAFCIAESRDLLAEGGVLTPATAFGMHLINRLNDREIEFKVVESFFS